MCDQKPFSSRSPSVLDYCDPSVTEAFAQFSNTLPTKCAKHQYYPLFFQNYHVDNFIFHSIHHKFNVFSLRSSKREPFVFMLLSLYPLPLKALVSVLEYPLVLRKKGEKNKKTATENLHSQPWQKLSCFLLLTTTWAELQPVQQHLWPVHQTLRGSRCVSFWTATFSLSSELGSIITFIIHQFYIYLPALRALRYKIKILVAKLKSSELPAPKKPNLN